MATTDEPSALDEAQVNEIASAVGPEKIKMLLGTFIENINRYLGDILAASQRSDLTAMKRGAHAMRGLSAQFGAQTLAKLTQQIEEEMKDVSDFKAVEPLLKQAVEQAAQSAERLRTA